jgi:hypothetical protein
LSPNSTADHYTYDANVNQGVSIENAGRIHETNQVVEVVESLLTVCVPTYPGTLPPTSTWHFAQAWELFTWT